ncbi:unnamed protein product [Alopecurus aequalis]
MEKLDKMCAANVHLDDGLAAEILVRLPAKSVLRFRAVCKEWLRITSHPAFIAEHARRRPLEVLLYTRTTVGPNAVAHLELDALSVDTHRLAPRRTLARFPDPENAEPRNEFRPYCRLLGSCDGLLLLGIGRADDGAKQYLICNPATRQWSDLPRLTNPDGRAVHQQELGFYFHEPTGEYRLLSYVYVSRQAPYYCVFSTGAEEPRRLGEQATTVVMEGFYGLMAHAILHGHMHWLNHMAGLTGQMLAFDTVAETFRWMPPPPVTRKAKTSLLVADGSLVASEILLGQPLVDLWVLEGYGGTAERWERRHRVRVEVLCPTHRGKLQLAASGDGGDVVLGTRGGVVAYNMRSGTVRKVVGIDTSRGGEAVLPLRSVFRESLVRHGFFDARPHPGLPLFSFRA